MFIAFSVYIFYIFNAPAVIAFWLLETHGAELKIPERNKRTCRILLVIVANIFSIGVYLIMYFLGIFKILANNIPD